MAAYHAAEDLAPAQAATLRAMMRCLIPLWQMKLHRTPADELVRKAEGCATLIASAADDMMRGDGALPRRQALNRLAEGFAAMLVIVSRGRDAAIAEENSRHVWEFIETLGDL